MKKIKNTLFIAAVSCLLLAGCNDDEGIGTQEQYNLDTELIDQYIEQNSLTVDIDEDNGIRYAVEDEGEGLTPYIVDAIRVTYTGKLLSTGEVVESGDNELMEWTDTPAAWRAILRHVRENGKLTFYLPSIYAYGSKGSGSIPPNANIIYELTLDEIQADELRSEIEDIDEYLSTNEINAEKDRSGLRYIINEEGSGDAPSYSSNIQVSYDGTVIGETEPFDQSGSASFSLSNLIAGWQLGLPLIKEGGNITLYIPATFGYGEKGSGQIPPNANLVFNIDLLAVQ